MSERDRYYKFSNKHPHPHLTFFSRPHFTRRRFFEILGSGVVGSYLVGKAKATQITTQNQTTKNTAQNCIFILLTGAISHTDSFDLKVVNGVTPSDFNPTTINGINWPAGLFPNMAQQLPHMAIVRSMQSHALVHTLAQTWSQIGRNPAAALGDIAPNIGSVVAIEKESERQPGQVFPTFLALNSPSGIGQGYFPATYAPFRLNEPVPATQSGVPDTMNPLGQPRLDTLLSRLHQLDDPLRINSPYSTDMQDYDEFYTAAKNLTYNPVVNQAFSFSAADSARYGGNSFGNSCLVAKQVLAANQGTRFIQISFGSWDMHVDIYGKQNPKGNNMYTMGKPLDAGVATLLGDLQSSGLLDQTLVVMVGEFGRTVGPITPALGRDHWLQQSIVFAGGGVQGGRTLGQTDSRGADTVDFGWSRGRYVYPEDVEATIYSAMGIDWTTIRYDDPFGRGFEYVPFSEQDLYGPVNELWGS
ncbi:MAG TPA: DUF1501 domain-containing protein [Bryobacteraceae bacterium]|nr:DUF1501 domain-containing protein [Bryobacteraceae bacterium]